MENKEVRRSSVRTRGGSKRRKDEAATSQTSRAAFGKYRLQAVRAGWSWGSCGDISLKVGLESTTQENIEMFQSI